MVLWSYYVHALCVQVRALDRKTDHRRHVNIVTARFTLSVCVYTHAPAKKTGLSFFSGLPKANHSPNPSAAPVPSGSIVTVLYITVWVYENEKQD